MDCKVPMNIETFDENDRYNNKTISYFKRNENKDFILQKRFHLRKLFSIIVIIMFMMIITPSQTFIFRMLNNKLQKIHKVSNNNNIISLSMSSVSTGGGGMSSGPSSSKGFIISPSLSTNEDEMLIIENFNQIQFGTMQKIGIIGTQVLTVNHQQMIELLSYALVLSGNHVFTSGGGNGTNIAVIRGALRACNPDLLTVILPQSLALQPPEMQLLLSRVANKLEQPQYDLMDLKEAANMCNVKILSCVDKCLSFTYHNSSSILGNIKIIIL
jgi:hypothetical protein